MKKIFIVLFALLFCSALFAEDFVVTTVKGNVKYETSEGVWEFLKPDETITGETFIDVKLNSQLEIKREDGKIYKIKSMQKGTVERLIAKYSVDKKDAINNSERVVAVSRGDDLIAKEDLTNHTENDFSKILNDFGFSPIKNLPAGKNVVRLCSSTWTGYDIIELTWTESTGDLVFLKGDIDDWDREPGDDERIKIKKRTELKVRNQDIKKIVDLIDQMGFHSQPSYVHTNGRDGETWYVEVNIDGAYKSISRWSPDRSFLRDIGYALYDLAKDE